MGLIDDANVLSRRLAVAPTEPAILLTDVEDIDACRQYFHARAIERNRALGLPLCRQCGTITDPYEGEYLHAGWCDTCSMTWLETRIIAPLVGALGQRGTRKALARLVRRLTR